MSCITSVGSTPWALRDLVQPTDQGYSGRVGCGWGVRTGKGGMSRCGLNELMFGAVRPDAVFAREDRHEGRERTFMAREALSAGDYPSIHVHVLGQILFSPRLFLLEHVVPPPKGDQYDFVGYCHAELLHRDGKHHWQSDPAHIRCSGEPPQNPHPQPTTGRTIAQLVSSAQCADTQCASLDSIFVWP